MNSSWANDRFLGEAAFGVASEISDKFDPDRFERGFWACSGFAEKLPLNDAPNRGLVS